ncbi:LppU/SCO3897 family protein [Actinoplanes couchii]|uniref:Uncharacterized protein n=1 Tax=Actinoplanes couchii TaxID=403638 RepID=A0ABQ3XJB5_9ACTN|nr:hypothetical protein [Actinoplanes couchii]MDR6324415.1 hypothetical protein [Actinoplanes couchii]GID58583.1 hypothetical protein Aco03nite_069870 [Actinoplanes couchii]
MSQNGPYPAQPWQQGGSPEESYSEAADPWVGQDPSWIPHQQQYAAAPQPPPAPLRENRQRPRRGFAMGATVAVLSVLIGGGLATAAWFVLGGEKEPEQTPVVAVTAPAVHVPRPQTSEDARFAAKGQCVRNEGTNNEPELRIVECTAHTYEILKRIDGRTTGEKDAVGKCAKVPKYTKWYYYDTEYDDVDFVLCLREYEPV